jgi:hypothetical protein
MRMGKSLFYCVVLAELSGAFADAAPEELPESELTPAGSPLLEVPAGAAGPGAGVAAGAAAGTGAGEAPVEPGAGLAPGGVSCDVALPADPLDPAAWALACSSASWNGWTSG